MENTIQENARKSLILGIKSYMSSFLRENSEIEIEKMIAGVMAFIWVNYFKDPYYPIDMFPSEEEKPKKWYQFWK